MARKPSGRRASGSSRLPQILILLFGFALIFAGKADLLVLREFQVRFNEFVTPLQKIISAPIEAVETMFEGARTVASLRAEAARLAAENKRLRRWQRRAELLESENRQLRSVAGVIVPQGRTVITARAVTAPGGSFLHSIQVEHGPDVPVQRGDPVVTADGLVGFVIETGHNYSWVLLVSDVNARIPVILSRLSWPGIAAGRNTGYLQLEFLPEEADPVIGELVQTSGHGGVLPAGIAVGRIVKADQDDIRIEPVVDLRKLSYVSILLRDPDAATGIVDADTFFSPLRDTSVSRLLEGFSPKDVLRPNDALPKDTLPKEVLQ